ncbi:CAP domain-containing protein [Streptomyces sioyaensis]|uniref:CAP domain-containing protein n=1 Tax=Streptomyces sioyaensis TaxID=67364 RepID=UPI003682D67A
MNNDHRQPEFPDHAPTGGGRRAAESAAHRRSGASDAGRSGGRHGRRSGLHRGGSHARRNTTVVAVAAVIVVGGSCVLLIRPGSGADQALAANQSVPKTPTATISPSTAPSASHSRKDRKPSASPSKSERPGKRHAAPRPHPTRSGTGSAGDTASRTPRVESGTGAGTPGGTQTATGTAARFAQKIVQLVNAQRAQHGCGPLTVDRHIQNAAQKHSDDMAARNYYEHNTPEGVDPGTRMTNAGFRWSSWAENIFKSPKDPATAMDGWMKSPGHRDNILNCSYKSTGVGVNLSANGPWWTQDFATHS